jgi:hypothetical protein
MMMPVAAPIKTSRILEVVVNREYSGVSRQDRGEEELTVGRFWEGLCLTRSSNTPAVAIRRV